MAQVLCHLPKVYDDNLIVGLDTSDDAAVYKINEDTALIQTLDFFTPVVDDPFTFGEIAATNSLSDIYAMGGEPKLAMNIVCFPNCLPPRVLTEILKGGYKKVKEAGALLIGGHSVEDDEPKYGLSVSGFVHPSKVLTNRGAKPGDVLVLTKPLGVGILSTAIKAQMIEKETYDKAVKIMTTLNKYGKNAMDKTEVNGCTDITGFGLLGHGLEMALASDVTIKIYSNKIPVINEALDFASMGLVPAGAYSNKAYIGDRAYMRNKISEELEDILFDPQTSGGLLISIKKDNVDILLEGLKNSPVEYGIVGEVVEKQAYPIIVE